MVVVSAGLFYNGTVGNLTCFNITAEYVDCADATGCGTGPAATSWDYQVCMYVLPSWLVGYCVLIPLAVALAL